MRFMPRISRTPRRLISALSRWYLEHGRDLPWRGSTDPYIVLVSEIMLQQTTVETAIPYFRRFVDRFPDIRSLARAGENEVLRLWSGLGYYRRARNLLAAAIMIRDGHECRVPEEPVSLRALPGIGPYTAAAVGAIAFGRPEVALDGNLKRVLARLDGIEGKAELSSVRNRIEKTGRLLVECGDPSVINQALMDLGSMICLPRRPRCEACPFSAECVARRRNLTDVIPPPKRKIEQVPVRLIAGMIRKGGRILLRRREGELMDGMWEIPMVEQSSGTDPVQTLSAEIAGLSGWEPIDLVRSGSLKHTITRHRIQVDLFSGSAGSRSIARMVAERTGTYSVLAGTDGPRQAKWFHSGHLAELPITGITRKIIREAGWGKSSSQMGKK
jgi:A/G-specific adenine glycosylase